MARKRIRIDLQDNDGIKYNFNLEGNVSKNKLLKIFELMDLLNFEDINEQHNENNINISVGSKIWNIIEKFFMTTTFTSTMLLEKYEDEYNTPIKLSIISTYLARFSNKKKIFRSKIGREWNYKLNKLLIYT